MHESAIYEIVDFNSCRWQFIIISNIKVFGKHLLKTEVKNVRN